MRVLAASFALTSVFASGHPIPKAYTCEGSSLSPPLRWTAPPRGTRSFAISVIDVDAGGFRHWLGWAIPAAARRLAAGHRPAREARNSAGTPGYTGPCPPPGSGVHHYVFRLYALDTAAGPAFAGHVLAVARLVGTFER